MMMFKALLTTLSLLAASHAAERSLLDPLPSVASGFSAIVTFGDSLCDNGTGSWPYSGYMWPPSFYAGGRFSNGPIWTELVAGNLSVPLYSYAIGGATSSSKLVQGHTWNGTLMPVPGTYEQITAFLEDPPAIDFASTLFVVEGGANDYILQPNNTGGVSASLLRNGVRKLKRAGATNFMFFNYPDMSLIPWDSWIPPANKTGFRTYSEQLSEALDHLANEVDGYYIDLIPVFYDFMYYGQPTLYGFPPFGAYGSCVVGPYQETPNTTICDNPDDYVFWDAYHPSAKAHQWIAKAALIELSS